MSRRIAAEFLGTLLLLVAVVGSGIMGERLAGGNMAVALLANALATGAALVVLITLFGPLSGAHFNPCVSLYAALRGEMAWGTCGLYAATQFIAAVCGVWLTHTMFAMPMLEISIHLRDGPAQWLAEVLATFGLLLTIAGAARSKPDSTPMLVGLYITGAYWFTASTSFANPAVTVARMLSDSFSGIAPHSVSGFIAAQLVGTLLAAHLLPWLFNSRN